MLMLLRLLVTAFDVFALGTAIYSTSLNYYYRCIGQIYRKPACYVNILNENICFVKQILDKNQKNVVEAKKAIKNGGSQRRQKRFGATRRPLASLRLRPSRFAGRAPPSLFFLRPAPLCPRFFIVCMAAAPDKRNGRISKTREGVVRSAETLNLPLPR